MIQSEAKENKLKGLMERESWGEVLGVEIEVEPLSPEVTPEIAKKLKEFGMELRYIPSLDLKIDELQKLSLKEYLTNLCSRYPKLNVFEMMSSKQKNDPSIGRLLHGWYWSKLKEGEIDLPLNDGNWVAVEMLLPPRWGKKYEETLVSEYLDFNDRCGLTWEKVAERIREKGPEIIKEVGLDSNIYHLDLPDVFTWNLLANREGWGGFDVGEWTNTTYSCLKKGGCPCCNKVRSMRVMVTGRSSKGGTAFVTDEEIWRSSPMVGFRSLIILEKR